MSSVPATSSKPLVFDVSGMDCGDCARSVERIVGALPDVGTAAVSFATGTLTVEPKQTADDGFVRAIGGAVERAGYSAMLRVNGASRVPEQVAWWKNRKLLHAIPSILLWLVAFALEHGFDQRPVAIAIFLAVIVVAGYPIARAAWAALRARRLDMNTLMTISVIGAALLGEWSEGALVVVLFTLGTTLQGMTFDHTRRAIRGLLDLSPDEATVLRDGVEVVTATSSLVVGDLVRIRPGDRIPADGVVESGYSAINQSAITGESIPVQKEPGDDVFSGTVNGAGSLVVRVVRTSSESTLSTIVRMVEEAQARKAPSQLLVDRFAAIYTPAVVVLAALIALGGALLLGDSETWTYRALVLLVVACPCALVISTPVSIVSAIGAATRSGVLVKGGAALETIGRVSAIAFDKTGTLTFGRPAVVDVVSLDGTPAPEILALAAAVEQQSEHPLARAIIARALHDDLAVPPEQDFASITGQGAAATIGDRRILVGSDRLLRESGANADAMAAIDAVAVEHAAHGRSTVVVAEQLDGAVQVLGVIAIADRVRPGAAEVLESLRRSGVKRLVMLTGDRDIVAQSIGRETGVDEIHADLLPQDKTAAIAAVQEKWGRVAMIGDGVNDAPALAAADAGIAMGIAGADAALESADLALMNDDLGALERLLQLSQQTLSVIRQNVVLSMVTKALALVLGAFGFVTLWVAVLIDVGTSLLVTMNGMRLAKDMPQAIREQAMAAHEDEACGCGGDHEHHHDHGQDHVHAA